MTFSIEDIYAREGLFVKKWNTWYSLYSWSKSPLDLSSLGMAHNSKL